MPRFPQIEPISAGGATPWLTRPTSSDDSDNISNKSGGSDRSIHDVTQMIRDLTSRDSIKAKSNKLKPVIRTSSRGSSGSRRSSANSVSPAPAQDKYSWKLGDIYPIIPGKLHFTCSSPRAPPSRSLRSSSSLVVSSELPKQYFSFCQDFGPNNLAIVLRFCEDLSSRMAAAEASNTQLVFRASDEPRIRTNSAFLISAFLVIERNYSPEDAVAPFEAIHPYPFRGYRDATNAPVTFEISILDCLRGLVKARSCGWFEPLSFNLKEYEYWDTPTNGDFHQISPKFIAFKGPVDARIEQGEYCHEPAHYFRPFQKKGVSAIVRLSEPDTYNARDFKQAGIRHYDLFFEDCTTPPEPLVREFLNICDQEEGVVAVHCKAGLGRTGTLIGAYLMRRQGFTAREAIAWLRLCRPGCVIGPQQHFLVELEERGWVGAGTPSRGPTRPSSSGSSSSAASASTTTTRTGSTSSTAASIRRRDKLSWRLGPARSVPLGATSASRPPSSGSPAAQAGAASPKASDLAEQVSKGMFLRARARESAAESEERRSWPGLRRASAVVRAPKLWPL